MSNAINHADLGRLSLCNSDYPWSVAFALAAAPHANHSITVDDAQVAVEKGQRDIVVRFGKELQQQSLLADGYRIAQRALDLFSMYQRERLVISNAATEYVLCWTEDNRTTLRMVDTAALTSEITATASAGNSDFPIPLVLPSPSYDTALRYYRMAHTATDVYEVFRLLYLALEHLLSRRSPRRPPTETQKRWEGEKAWLRRALSDAGDLTKIGDLMPGNSPETRAEWFLDNVYEVRNRLFHAKRGESPYLPNDSLEEQGQIGDSSLTLTYLVTLMLEYWCGVTGRRGEFSRVVLETMAAAALPDDARIFVSSQQSIRSFDEGTVRFVDPEHGVILESNVKSIPLSHRLRTLEGSVQNPTDKGLRRIREIDIVQTDNAVLVTSAPTSDIILQRIDRLECVLHISAHTVWHPKALRGYK